MNRWHWLWALMAVMVVLVPGSPGEAESDPVVIGQRTGGVVWVEASQVFAVALDDAVLFVNESGSILRTTTNVPGASDPRVEGGHVFVASSSTGKIIQIDPATANVVETWNTGATGPVSIDVTSGEIWFLTEPGPIEQGFVSDVGSIDRTSDVVTLSRLVGVSAWVVRVSEAHPDIVVVTARSSSGGVAIWDVSETPAVLVAGTSGAGPSVEIAADGSRAWAVADDSIVGIREVSLLDGAQVPNSYIVNSRANGIALSPSDEFVAVQTFSQFPGNGSVFVFRPGQPSAVGFFDIGTGLIPLRNAIALSDSHVAVLRQQFAPDAPNARLFIEPFTPQLTTVVYGAGIEAGIPTEVTITGKALGSITGATIDGALTPVTVASNGLSLTLRLPAMTAGTKQVLVASRAGTASIELEIIPPLPRWTMTACPEITDSITRLYSAYFLRQSDQAGFEFWLDNYSSGVRNLDSMSDFFSVSAEFQATYGGLSNAEFVDLVYQNVLGRAGDTEGRAFWISQLDSGAMSRGTVMINFSESSEYVTISETAIPLAGFFNWYAEGAVWLCGEGQAIVVLGDTKKYVDLVVYNQGPGADSYSLERLINGQWQADSFHLVAGETYGVNGASLSEVAEVRINVPDDFRWMIVRSPSPTPATRSGWETVDFSNGS